MKDECSCNEVQFAVSAQSGFSKRIHTYATKTHGNNSLTGFIAGPYGAPPRWEAYESLILISASTGASYTLPILESILSGRATICTQRISFLLVVRNRSHIDFYAKRLNSALSGAEALGIDMSAEVAITNDISHTKDASVQDDDSVKETKGDEQATQLREKKDIKEDKIEPYILAKPQSTSRGTSSQPTVPGAECSCANGTVKTVEATRHVVYSYSRPDISAFIRRTVEVTGGETSVGVCGGRSLVAKVRNSVASLSDERAVHKGTGAQGIHLHVEEYCF